MKFADIRGAHSLALCACRLCISLKTDPCNSGAIVRAALVGRIRLGSIDVAILCLSWGVKY